MTAPIIIASVFLLVVFLYGAAIFFLVRAQRKKLGNEYRKIKIKSETGINSYRFSIDRDDLLLFSTVPVFIFLGMVDLGLIGILYIVFVIFHLKQKGKPVPRKEALSAAQGQNEPEFTREEAEKARWGIDINSKHPYRWIFAGELAMEKTPSRKLFDESL